LSNDVTLIRGSACAAMHKDRLSHEAERVGEHARADAAHYTLERASTRALDVEYDGQHAEHGLDSLA
jgi:hypothetical protein